MAVTLSTESLIDELIRRIPADEDAGHVALVMCLGNFQDELWRKEAGGQ